MKRHNYNYEKFVGYRMEGSRVSRREGIDHTIRYTFDEAYEIFVNAKKAEGCRERTIKDYYMHKNYLLSFLNEYSNSIEFVEDLTVEHIRGYINFLINQKRPYAGIKNREKKRIGLAPVTINMRLKTLRAFYNFLVKENIVKESPMKNIKLLKEDQEVVKSFTDKEINKLLNVIDIRIFAGYRDRVMIYLYLDGGYRVNEVVNLKREDIDFENKVISIKGSIEKTRRHRFVPVSNFVLKMIKNLMNENDKFFPGEERLFLSSFGDPLNADTIRRRLYRYAKKAEIKSAPPGRFRHTFAKNYLKNGGDVMTLSKIMGHTDISTTRRYLQFTSEEIVSAHEKFSPSRKFYKRRMAGRLR